MGEALDNATKRATGFRQVLDAMLTGGSSKEALEPWQPLLDDCRPEDLVMVVDAAVADGIDFSRLKPAVSRLINLMHASLVKHRYVPQDTQPFFAALMAENRGLLQVLEQGKAATKALNDPDPAVIASGLSSLKSLAESLGAVEIHFRKKENVLFPWFEARYPQFRCVRLMWELHDDARRSLKSLASLLGKAWETVQGNTDSTPADVPTKPLDTRPINALVGKLYFDLNTNLFREECALFPVMASLVPEAEGQAMFIEAHEYGYAFLAEAEEAAFLSLATQPGTKATATTRAADGTSARGGETGVSGFSGRTGSLPPEILGALFSTIHLDMTWVDAGDKVRWFSDSPKRIFPRSPSIIGRDVRNCHPGASVGRVVSILEDFKAGRKDREAFWLTMKDRFIHIEYFALRGQDGSYLGTLEASEDLTDKRGLQGEKRLVE